MNQVRRFDELDTVIYKNGYAARFNYLVLVVNM